MGRGDRDHPLIPKGRRLYDVHSSGSEDTWNGVLSISKSGAITSPDDLLLRGTMDAGKTVMVLISPRDDDTTAFHVFTRIIDQ